MTMTALDWHVAANAAAHAGGVTELVYCLRRALALDSSDPAVHQALITNLDMLPYVSDRVRRAARLAFDREHVVPIMQSSAGVGRVGHANNPDPDRRLRIGYVSADLFNSSAAYCHGALIVASPHQQGDIYVYASTSVRARADDPVTPAFKAAADYWRDVTAMDNHEVASLILSDQIDVLIDLGGYSSGSRMLVFAHRPAPIQITGWGHCTGTDLSCFDYTAADVVTIPPEHEHRHREAILRVPSTIIYVPTGDHAITYRQSDHVTFGYLGRPEKISAECLAAWADILHAVPNSRLLLKSMGCWERPERRSRVLVPLGAYGIGSDRVEFRGETANREHLLTYNEIDVHLDSFWHTGGVSMGDACWMGAPSVTLLGQTVSGRIGASILTTLGHQSRIARTVDEYREIAVNLARNVPRFRPGSREEMRRQMERSVLVDSGQYAAAVEASYRAVWRRWCAVQARVPVAV